MKHWFSLRPPLHQVFSLMVVLLKISGIPADEEQQSHSPSHQLWLRQAFSEMSSAGNPETVPRRITATFPHRLIIEEKQGLTPACGGPDPCPQTSTPPAGELKMKAWPRALHNSVAWVLPSNVSLNAGDSGSWFWRRRRFFHILRWWFGEQLISSIKGLALRCWSEVMFILKENGSIQTSFTVLFHWSVKIPSCSTVLYNEKLI